MPERNRHQLELNWQPLAPGLILPEGLADWIRYSGSFMNRLRAQGGVFPRVQVIRQAWDYPALNEKKILGLRMRAYALIREVLITSPGKQWMVARCVFPRSTLTGKELCLARLKTRSLGSVLFRDPNIKRSAFDVIRLSKNGAFHQAISTQCRRDFDLLWARRSTFTLQGKSLLLTEVFLPDLETL